MSEVINKHSRMPKNGESAPVFSKRGLGNKHVPIDQRNAIIEDAKKLILEGRTIDQIADKHGIAPRTLEYWLAGLGEEYEEVRRQWIDNMLAEAGDLLHRAMNPTAIAKSRELWKRAAWYAERRDKARYGQDMQQVHVHVHDLGDRLRRARERVIGQTYDNELGHGAGEDLRLAHARDPA